MRRLLATVYTGKGIKAKAAKGRKRHSDQGMDRGEIVALGEDSPEERARQDRNRRPKAEALVIFREGSSPFV